MESRYGRYAVTGLIRYVVAMNALVYILIKLNPDFGLELILWPQKILQGEVWRLVSYIFIPQFGGIFPDWFNAAMYMVFLWWVGNGLEHALGAFRLNLYYFIGMAGITVAAFFEAIVTHDIGGGFSAVILNTSLLFAFAQFYPDEVIFFMYILPLKVKWLAWLAAVGLVYELMLNGGWSYPVSLVAALANYFIFFGPEVYRNARLRHQVADRRRKFEEAKIPDTATLHECAVCHRTEVTNPDIEFRVARDGQEYCKEHLPKAGVRD
jgi:hypothetical protein